MSRSFPRKELTAWWLVHTTGGRKGHLGYLLLKRPVTYWRIFCLKKLFCQYGVESLLHNLVRGLPGAPCWSRGPLLWPGGFGSRWQTTGGGLCSLRFSWSPLSLTVSLLAFAHSLLGFLSSLYITFPSVLSSLLPLPSVKSFLWNCS